jgi:predicted tellurium resistance membrane protein TerC
MLYHLLAKTWDFAALVAPENIVENLIALVTLTVLEIVLGIDNIVFIAILCGKLPEEQRRKARRTGLMLALVTRVALLLTISFIIQAAKTNLFTLPFGTEPIKNSDGTTSPGPIGISGKDLILIIGGAFLIAKATLEIHHKIEDKPDKERTVKHAAFWSIIFQILIIDVVFSLDSVITAVGMARAIEIMIAAVMISVGIMLVASGAISAFIDKHPTMKMLALAFLVLIGVVLVADGFGQHVGKGYIYFAMAFSLGVEMLNIIVHRKPKAAA